jgi:hypothetical protein
MGFLDRVEGVERLPPPPLLVPPLVAELRVVALLVRVVPAAVRAAGAGLEDTVLAVTVTGVEGAGWAGELAEVATAGAGIAVTGVAAVGLDAAGLASVEAATAGLAAVGFAAVVLAVARDLGVAMGRRGGARWVVRGERSGFRGGKP